MIAIDLQCSQGHTFEGWFEGLDAFEEQNEKNLIGCPYCEDTNIRRALSPVAVRKSASQSQQAALPVDYQKLAGQVVEYINKNFEDVGSRFAAEALKMHYGVTDKRNIRGSATPEEEKTLKNEGIDFIKLPLSKKEDKENEE